MRLYLVQHGDAVQSDADPARPLSATGQRDVERLAAFFTRQDIDISRIFHSGKLRAQQTAEIIASRLSPDVRVEARSGLDPNDAPAPVAHDLAQTAEDTLVVSHLPFLGKLASRLVTGQEALGIVAFQPGTVVCLERREAGAWTVCWMMTPRIYT